MSYWHLQTTIRQPVAVAAAGTGSLVAASTDRSDVSRQRHLAVNDDVDLTRKPS